MTEPCKAFGCTKPRHGSNYCEMHVTRLRRHGVLEPERTAMRFTPAEDRMIRAMRTTKSGRVWRGECERVALAQGRTPPAIYQRRRYLKLKGKL